MDGSITQRKRILGRVGGAAVLAALIVAAVAPAGAQAAGAATCVLNVATVGLTPIPDLVADASDLHLEDVESGVFFGFGAASTGPATACVGAGGPVVGGGGSYAFDVCYEGRMWGTLTVGGDSIRFRMDMAAGWGAFDVISVNGAPAAGGGPVTWRPSPGAGDCGVTPVTGIDITGTIAYAWL